MATKAAANDQGEKPDIALDQPPSLKVEDRLSLELVIALVGPVASGVSTAGGMIKEILEDKFDYKVDTIKVSPIIRENAHLVGETISDDLAGEDRIEKYQLVGNKLREKKSKHFLIDCVMDKIAKTRVDYGGFYTGSGSTPVPLPKRFAYIIDSLKNPAELAQLRQIYGDLLWVVTVFGPHDVRKMRLKSNGGEELAAQKVMKKDHQDDESFGQQVSKTAHLADFFIRNHKDTRESLRGSVNRFLEVVFGTSLHTPTFDEQGMMRAASAALESACLSRQVGASIYSSSKELIGVGCNDVPKFGGGLYSEADQEEDKRCFRWGGQFCHNDEHKSLTHNYPV